MTADAQPASRNAGVVGVLLAAGRGQRFDASGGSNKLLQTLRGAPVVIHALRSLAAAVDRVVAVVRPDADALQQLLQQAGCEVTVCPDAALGMGHSLAHVFARLQHEDGVRAAVVMLADMPDVQPSTVAALVAATMTPGSVVAPEYRGERGNPVAFGREHFGALAACDGDRGAGPLLKSLPLRLLPVDDAGVMRDVDTPKDLDALQHH